jgi:hypothetical protein
MMPSVYKIFLALGLLYTFTCCSDLKKKEHMDAIDSMTVTLDSIGIVLKANQIDTLHGIIGAAMQVELRIKNNYYADTIDMELGKKMDAFKRMRKGLPGLGNLYSEINTGVQEQKESLLLLKNDIEKGNGERKKYGEYIVFEQQKTNQLRSLIREYVAGKEKTMSVFNELYPELNAFSMLLLNKPKPKKQARYLR